MIRLFATHGFATFENEVWCVQMAGRFCIKVCWHNFAFSTRLTNFSIVPAILISISCAVLKL